jgi:sodium/potassium-transporting ATPase subunit alpha
MKRYGSDEKLGLTTALAEEKFKTIEFNYFCRIREYGKNHLSEKKKTPWFVKLWHELTGMFSLLLWAGGVLCFIAFGLD